MHHYLKWQRADYDNQARIDDELTWSESLQEKNVLA
jgi:hypothetical protein